MTRSPPLADEVSLAFPQTLGGLHLVVCGGPSPADVSPLVY